LNTIIALLTSATSFSYALSIAWYVRFPSNPDEKPRMPVSLSVYPRLTLAHSILQKRLRSEPLPPSRFSLGKFGVPINIFAVLYVTVACIASFFPVVNSTDVADMNWSVVMFGGVLVIACVDYMFRGRKHYVEPVRHLNKM
jgi:amino acid transporter